jgi:hypothetical protein
VCYLLVPLLPRASAFRTAARGVTDGVGGCGAVMVMLQAMPMAARGCRRLVPPAWVKSSPTLRHAVL